MKKSLRVIKNVLLMTLSTCLVVCCIVLFLASYLECVFCGHRTEAYSLSASEDPSWLLGRTETQAAGMFCLNGVVAFGKLDQKSQRRVLAIQGRVVLKPSTEHSDGFTLRFTADRLPLMPNDGRHADVVETGRVEWADAASSRIRIEGWLLLVMSALLWLATLGHVTGYMRHLRGDTLGKPNG
jgi:hypothetical protein